MLSRTRAISVDFRVPGFEKPFIPKQPHFLANDTKGLRASRRLPSLGIGSLTDMKLASNLEGAAATRRATCCVLRAACCVHCLGLLLIAQRPSRVAKGPGPEFYRHQTRGKRGKRGGEKRERAGESRERGPEAEIRPLSYRS